jgi:hypothetical protein
MVCLALLGTPYVSFRPAHPAIDGAVGDYVAAKTWEDYNSRGLSHLARTLAF